MKTASNLLKTGKWIAKQKGVLSRLSRVKTKTKKVNTVSVIRRLRSCEEP